MTLLHKMLKAISHFGKANVSNQRFASQWWFNSTCEKPNYSVINPQNHKEMPQIDFRKIPDNIRLPYYAQTGKMTTVALLGSRILLILLKSNLQQKSLVFYP